ncbi:hypothetical protein IX27_02805 [Streptomyces sp. JS01]|uniref:hypothetical protein n=1 Tax=Streptomyces sp. JS01 TaxID=1525753 RepID=UPI0005035FD3|nr:hypothetical protein [Streptomyces sp. JS01]KFK89982.1 hypothetical protein IX27_02805 [Streptomyces sp. JS01]
MRITAPVADFTGDGPGGIPFVDGTATSGDPAVIGYCQGAGYTVEPLGDDPPDTEQSSEQDGPADTTSTGRSAARSKRG